QAPNDRVTTVDEISPDLISRMASRIYNEKPQTDGVPAFSAAPPAPPSMQSVPEGIPQHMGSLPFSVASMPHAAPFSPEPSAASADSPQKTVAPPQFAHWP